ncbi:MAG: hypothetical protein RLZZ303_2129 [Candidatus Hydrogenedentota bacterium]|jgi:glycosyltransferase involved in cell wall biosynthesis
MRVAYLASLYPAQSHTFIQREIAGLRQLGFHIDTYSIRRATGVDVQGAEGQADLAATRWLLPPPPADLLAAFCWAVVTRPVLALRVLFEAIGRGGLGLRGYLLWCAYFVEALVLAYWLTRDKADHLHCHFGNAGSNTAYLASKLSGVPLSITFHGIDLDEPEKFRHAEKLAHARFAVCISKFGRSRLMFATPPGLWNRIHIVHCGLDAPGETSITPSPGEGHILCVARLSVEKGHPILLDALDLLRARGIPFLCTLVGDGPLRDELKARVKAMGLDELVKFAGAQPPAMVAEFNLQCDVLVLASFGEGIPVVLMEAMAHARPVVATYVGGIPELVHDGVNGRLVPAGSATDLADAIAEILMEPERARNMGQAGRAEVLQHFRLDGAAERMAALFKQGEAAER